MSIKNLVSQGVQDIFAALKGERVVENHFLALSHIQAEGLLFLLEHPIDPDIFQRDDGEATRAAQSEMASALRQSIENDAEPLMIAMTPTKKVVIGIAVSTLSKSLENLISPQSLIRGGCQK